MTTYIHCDGCDYAEPDVAIRVAWLPSIKKNPEEFTDEWWAYGEDGNDYCPDCWRNK